VAYVADWVAGLQIIDVSTPSAPTLLATLDTTRRAFGVTVVSGVAYVAAWTAGLQIIDLQHLSFTGTPTLQALGEEYTLRLEAKDSVGNIAHTNFTLLVAQLPALTNQALTTQSLFPEEALSFRFNPATLFTEPSEERLRLSADRTDGSLLPGWLEFALAPYHIATMDTVGFSLGLSVVSGIAYVLDHNSGLQIIDVSTPSAPTLLVTLDTPGYTRGVSVVSGVAYVTDHTAGLQIIDVSTPSAPTLLATLNTTDKVRGLSVVSGVAYVADGASGLQIINVSIP
ncbi:unnamed protein product, partial [marine sediment metagenome]